MAKTMVARFTPEAVRLLDGMAGPDSILTLVPGFGELSRSEVVVLACQVLALVAADVAKHDGHDGHPNAVTEASDDVQALDLLYNRWIAARKEYDPDPDRVRLARLEQAVGKIRDIAASTEA